MADPSDPTPSVPEPLRVEVVPEPAQEALAPGLRSALAAHPVVRVQYPGADLSLVALDVLDKEEGPDAEFRAILHDVAGNQVLEAYGFGDDASTLDVVPTGRPRLPDEDEHAWAVDVLRADPELARRIDAGEVSLYRPMPPLANVQSADGTVDRAVTVGLRERVGEGDGAAVRHRVVAVRTADGEILEQAPGLPRGDVDCGAERGPEGTPVPGDARARVRVWRGEELLWDLVVVRPSRSSGTNGSGVELRTVDYQRVRLLHRAHVPVLNVAYDAGDHSCGPTYREWLNDEAWFEAEGDEPVPGFRVCAQPPGTIVDTGRDGGGFRGVALHLDGEELLIVSVLQAGWYRYVSEWRLAADGTIRPRMGFAAVSNPCTCRPHTQHAYWRLDFDIVTPDVNQVQEHNDPPLPGQLSVWHTIRYEVGRPRDAAHRRRWRVRSTRSPHGYAVVPGDADGTADDYGVGDVWVLAYHGDEVDDGQGFSTNPAETRAQLDEFVSGELVERRDVVLWYAAHVRHAPGQGEPEGGHRVGPDLEPFNWRPPVERGPYIPIAPPPPEPVDEDEPSADE